MICIWEIIRAQKTFFSFQKFASEVRSNPAQGSQSSLNLSGRANQESHLKEITYTWYNFMNHRLGNWIDLCDLDLVRYLFLYSNIWGRLTYLGNIFASRVCAALFNEYRSQQLVIRSLVPSTLQFGSSFPFLFCWARSLSLISHQINRLKLMAA